MVRKMSLIFVLLFYKINSTMKVLYILLILCVNLGIQQKKSPFYTAFLNDLEFKSILVSTITLFFGLLYNISQSTAMKIIMVLVIVFANGYFLLLIIKKLLEINQKIFLSFIKFFQSKKVNKDFGNKITNPTSRTIIIFKKREKKLFIFSN
jgi:hypothetical protein